MTMNGETKEYPIQTQIHACHHERPSCTIELTIIHLRCRCAPVKIPSKINLRTINERIDVETVCDPAGDGVRNWPFRDEAAAATNAYNAKKLYPPQVLLSFSTGNKSSFYKKLSGKPQARGPTNRQEELRVGQTGLVCHFKAFKNTHEEPTGLRIRQRARLKARALTAAVLIIAKVVKKHNWKKQER
jgi:hypothetical protein